jgi:hypothetical protein
MEDAEFSRFLVELATRPALQVDPAMLGAETPLALQWFARRAKVSYAKMEAEVREEIEAKCRKKPKAKPTPPNNKARRAAVKRAVKATVRVPAALRGTKLHARAKKTPPTLRRVRVTKKGVNRGTRKA